MELKVCNTTPMFVSILGGPYYVGHLSYRDGWFLTSFRLSLHCRYYCGVLIP